MASKGNITITVCSMILLTGGLADPDRDSRQYFDLVLIDNAQIKPTANKQHHATMTMIDHQPSFTNHKPSMDQPFTNHEPPQHSLVLFRAELAACEL